MEKIQILSIPIAGWMVLEQERQPLSECMPICMLFLPACQRRNTNCYAQLDVRRGVEIVHWLEICVRRSLTIHSFNTSTHSDPSPTCRVIELQAFLVDLIGNFEFSLTPEAQRVRREAAGVMTPTIEGQVEKGTQLPLRISVALRDALDD